MEKSSDPWAGTAFDRELDQPLGPSDEWLPKAHIEILNYDTLIESALEPIELFLEEEETRECSDIPYIVFRRIELYMIRVPDEEERKLLTEIVICNPEFEDEVLYDRSAIDFKDESFLLRGPSRPPEACNPIEFLIHRKESVGLFGFSIYWRRYPIDVILSEDFIYIRERLRQFLININFEVITHSVEAYIDITLPGCEIGGEIFATTDGFQITKRILASSTKFDNPLRLDRSVLAMRIGEFLHLHFDLGITYEKGDRIPYKGVACIEVPEIASEISGVCNIVTELEWNMMKKMKNKGIKRTSEGEPHEYRIRLSDCQSKIPLQIKIKFQSIPSYLNRNERSG